MKSNKKVPKITPYDVAMINSLISSEDFSEKAVEHVMKCNTELFFMAHRLLKKRMRTDPDSFPDRVLITVLGVASDKINAAKKKVKKEANGVAQEEKGSVFDVDSPHIKRVGALEMKEILKEVRAKQRKAQEEGLRELKERREGGNGSSEEDGVEELETKSKFVDGIPW